MNPLFVSVPDVPVRMLGTCSGDIAVLGRCLLLCITVITYFRITVHAYAEGDKPTFSALLATFVLTGADLLPKICHENHEYIIEWVISCALLALGMHAYYEKWLSENVSVGIITGSAANIYKKVALLLICRSEFREVLQRSLQRYFPSLMNAQATPAYHPL